MAGWPAGVVGARMRCLVCDTEMRLAEVVPDDTMLVPGYEHHTFRCPQCGDEERRLVFVRAGESRGVEPVPSASEPPALQPDEPAAPAKREPQLAGPVSAAAPVETRPARRMPLFALPAALTRRLSKLVTTIGSLPASAARLARLSFRKAPPASAPVLDRRLPSPAAPPALPPLAAAPISFVAEWPVTDLAGPARRPPDPDSV